MDKNSLHYLPSHEWVGVAGDVATIGITDFAVSQLTDLTYIELPQVGAKVTQGERFGEVESVKAVSDLFAPLSGKVIKVNSPLGDSPEYLNDDPYDEGWMLQIELSKPEELKELMDAAAYDDHVKAG